jgi:predicted ribosomally synthesized peptide with SipW-like signal peptide
MNKRLPLGLLAILLIVLLAGIGVAYGLWSETLTIDGTVNTGEVNITFDGFKVYEGVQVGNQPVGPEKPDKAPYANCAARITGANDSEKLEVTVDGAYPSWHCYVFFKVKSTGTVPVHVYQPVAGRNNPTWSDLKLECRDWPPYPYPSWPSNTPTLGSESAEIEQNLGTSCSTSQDSTIQCTPQWWQLHTNNVLYCKLTVHFTNDDNVPERTNGIKFAYTIEARQWNEPR